MLLSVVVALILTPSLCATMLKPVAKGHEAAEAGFFLTRPFFLWFDRMLLPRERRVSGDRRAGPRQACPLSSRLRS